jgi:hypothetical protein
MPASGSRSSGSDEASRLTLTPPAALASDHPPRWPHPCGRATVPGVISNGAWRPMPSSVRVGGNPSGRASTRAPCRLPRPGRNDGFPFGSGVSPGPLLPPDTPLCECGTLLERLGGAHVQRRE